MDRAADNPWPEWPKVYKLDYGQEEAAAMFGADPRVYRTTATKFEDDGNGRVKAIHLVDIEWSKNDKGQFVPRNVDGTERVVPADLVLLAMGFLGPEAEVLDHLGVEQDARGNVDAAGYLTSVDGVFAAGDARRGQSLIVWAINEGRQCAAAVNAWLEAAEGGNARPASVSIAAARRAE